MFLFVLREEGEFGSKEGFLKISEYFYYSQWEFANRTHLKFVWFWKARGILVLELTWENEQVVILEVKGNEWWSSWLVFMDS